MKKSTLAFTLLAASALYACATAPPQQTFAQQAAPSKPSAAPAVSNVDTILMQLKLHSFEVRTGRSEGAAKGVALMEEATKANPNEARLWAGLGTSYFNKANVSFLPGGKFAEGLSAFQRAEEAHAKALAIDPTNADALAGHGFSMAILASFQPKPGMREEGMAEMARAIELAPANTSIRLQRAFMSVNLPLASRNRAAELEDLGYLARLANGTRQGDYVRVLLGDVLFEGGDAARARQEYEAVAKSDRPGGAEARARLAALDKGEAVATADIMRVRQATGSNCMMCHGS